MLTEQKIGSKPALLDLTAAELCWCSRLVLNEIKNHIKYLPENRILAV